MAKTAFSAEKNKLPVLIVGQGLAGSVLAVSLGRAGYPLRVVDEKAGAECSRVAAGLMNPITGRQFALTWRAGEVFPLARQCYRQAEQLLGARFFYPRRIFRPFQSIKQQNKVLPKTAEPEYQPFMGNSRYPHQALVEAPHGALEIGQGGFVAVSAFLDAVSKWLGPKLSRQSFDFHKLQTQNGLSYGGEALRAVVFCQGFRAENPFWPGLALSPNRGEVLSLRVPEWDTEDILIKGLWMVPFQKGKLRAGATYDPQNPLPQSTREGRQRLEERLQANLRIGFSVETHEAGVRPATPDRRPHLGDHPEIPGLYLLNGLGSKGTTLAPWLAHCLLRHWEAGEPLPAEVGPYRGKGP